MESAINGLTQEQIRFFNTFGFLYLRTVLPPNDVLIFTRELLEMFSKDRCGRVYDGTKRQQVDAFIEHSCILSPLATDNRVLTPIRSLLGTDCIWIGSDGNLYAGNSGWHPDGSNLAFRRIKALFYLEPLAENTGALRIIAGSHRDPLHSDLLPLLQRSDKTITPYGVVAPLRDQFASRPLGTCADNLPHTCLETIPGDMILFDQNIWHSSYGGRSGRMMFTLNYGEAPKTESQLDFVRQMYEGQRQFCSSYQLTPFESLFPVSFIRSNTDDVLSLLRIARQLGYSSS